MGGAASSLDFYETHCEDRPISVFILDPSFAGVIHSAFVDAYKEKPQHVRRMVEGLKAALDHIEGQKGDAGQEPATEEADSIEKINRQLLDQGGSNRPHDVLLMEFAEAVMHASVFWQLKATQSSSIAESTKESIMIRERHHQATEGWFITQNISPLQARLSILEVQSELALTNAKRMERRFDQLREVLRQKFVPLLLKQHSEYVERYDKLSTYDLGEIYLLLKQLEGAPEHDTAFEFDNAELQKLATVKPEEPGPFESMEALKQRYRTCKVVRDSCLYGYVEQLCEEVEKHRSEQRKANNDKPELHSDDEDMGSNKTSRNDAEEEAEDGEEEGEDSDADSETDAAGGGSADTSNSQACTFAIWELPDPTLAMAEGLATAAGQPEDAPGIAQATITLHRTDAHGGAHGRGDRGGGGNSEQLRCLRALLQAVERDRKEGTVEVLKVESFLFPHDDLQFMGSSDGQLLGAIGGRHMHGGGSSGGGRGRDKRKGRAGGSIGGDSGGSASISTHDHGVRHGSGGGVSLSWGQAQMGSVLLSLGFRGATVQGAGQLRIALEGLFDTDFTTAGSTNNNNTNNRGSSPSSLGACAHDVNDVWFGAGGVGAGVRAGASPTEQVLELNVSGSAKRGVFAPRRRHWRRLAQLERLRVLDLVDTSSNVWTQTVAQRMERGMVSELRLDWTRLSDEQVVSLCESVGSSTSLLHTLSLQQCDLSRSNCRIIEEKLRANPYLTHVNLNGNDKVNDRVVLAMLSPRMKTLCLDDCTLITDDAIRYITHKCKTLRKLSINYCGITDRALAMISRSLLKLEALHMRWCSQITGEGVQDVAYFCTKLEVIDVAGCSNVADDKIATDLSHCVDVSL